MPPEMHPYRETRVKQLVTQYLLGLALLSSSKLTQVRPGVTRKQYSQVKIEKNLVPLSYKQ